MTYKLTIYGGRSAPTEESPDGYALPLREIFSSDYDALYEIKSHFDAMAEISASENSRRQCFICPMRHEYAPATEGEEEQLKLFQAFRGEP